jgi:hypothetical protein
MVLEALSIKARLEDNEQREASTQKELERQKQIKWKSDFSELDKFR